MRGHPLRKEYPVEGPTFPEDAHRNDLVGQLDPDDFWADVDEANGALTVDSGVAGTRVDLEQGSGDNMILNMGPQHPSTHGVLRLVI